MHDLERFFFVAVAAIFGASVGSFLNVCIYRLPRPGLSLSRPTRSFCPVCGERIAARDNIPLVSWVLLGGRCRTCRAPIPWRYFIVECVTAALFVLVVDRWLDAVRSGEASWGGALVLLVVTSGLIVATFVDMELRLIPDVVTIGGMHLVPIAVLFFPELHGLWPDAAVTRLLTAWDPWLHAAHEAIPNALSSFPVEVAAMASAFVAAASLGGFAYRAWRRRFLPELPRRVRDVSLAAFLSGIIFAALLGVVLEPHWLFTPRFHALVSALLGMLTGSALVWIVGAVGSLVFRKPAMGFGDVKLMGLIGALAGWKGALLAFFLACVLGSIYGIIRVLVWRDRTLPFGPFLAFGGFVLTLWPRAVDAALEWYVDFFIHA